MTCDDCDFWHGSGGTCQGYQKNRAAVVPVYVCPHAVERARILEYFDRAAVKLAEPFWVNPSTSFALCLQHVSSPVPVT